jgi:hypothetical protein
LLPYPGCTTSILSNTCALSKSRTARTSSAAVGQRLARAEAAHGECVVGGKKMQPLSLRKLMRRKDSAYNGILG